MNLTISAYLGWKESKWLVPKTALVPFMHMLQAMHYECISITKIEKEA